jgi:hypothetical protein
MRKVISGITYDTELATIDKKFTYGEPGNPEGYEETLYITPDGHYFIYLNGGKKSKYPNEDIHPIEHDQVKSWVLYH